MSITGIYVECNRQAAAPSDCGEFVLTGQPAWVEHVGGDGTTQNAVPTLAGRVPYQPEVKFTLRITAFASAYVLVGPETYTPGLGNGVWMRAGDVLTYSAQPGDRVSWAATGEVLPPVFTIGAQGLYSGRSAYDSEAPGFVYLSTNGDAGATTTLTMLFFRVGAVSGTWSDGVVFQGPAGAQGPAGPTGPQGPAGADGTSAVYSNATPEALGTPAAGIAAAASRADHVHAVPTKSAIGLGNVDNLATSITTVGLASVTVPAEVLEIRTCGHATAGDGGGAKLARDAAGTITSADGAKWRIASEVINPLMFGAKGDGVTDDAAAIQTAWDFAGANKVPCAMLGLEYSCSTSVFTSSNLTVLANYATMYITQWPSVGGFINNVRPVAAERAQSNIWIDRLITDGGRLPHYFQAKSVPLQAENLVASQINFDQAAWTKTGGAVTMNAAQDPFNNTVADRFTEDTSTGTHLVSQTVSTSVSGGEMIVLSCYVKLSSTSRTVNLSLSGTAFGAFSTAAFNLSLNKVITQSSDLYVAEVQTVGNGWSRVTIAKRTTVTGTYTVGVYMSDASGNRSYTGGGTNYLDLGICFSNVAGSHNTNLGPEFAWGASNVRITNCIARKCRVGVGGGTGGGGFGGELGLKDVQFIGCTVEDCFRGLRVAGNGVDTLSTGATEEAADIVFRDTTVRRCGTAVFAHSVGHTGDDVSDLVAFDALFDGLYIQDCGHNAWSPIDWVVRSTVGGPQKSGVIALGGAQNCRFRNVRIALSATLTTTDVDWLGRAGYANSNWASGQDGYVSAGLTGKVESIVGGWGQNVQFDGVELDGTATCAFKIHRVNLMGDLGSSAPTEVVTTETVRQFVFANFRHVRANGGQLDYAFDCQSGVNNSRVSVTIRNFTRNGTFVSGVVGANASGLSNISMVFLDNGGQLNRGTASEWYAYGNALPASSQFETSLSGYDYGGGYSATGARAGQSYDSASGYLRSSQNASTTKYHHAFYNTNGLVGGITTNGTATTFATSSDERKKQFSGAYAPEAALALIKQDPVREFTWLTDGKPGIGWGAQTSAKVRPEFAVPGMWMDPETGQEVPEGTEGAVESPWAIDLQARIPHLWAAVAGLLAELEEAKQRLAALEAAKQ